MPLRLESQAEPIPGYKLLERLGGGGFGEVWKAEAPGGLLKAIKFVYGDLDTTDQERVRAEQELRSLARVKTVRHPYILSLERYDIVNGQLLIVMELADRNLWDRFRECRSKGLTGIPREELLGYMSESAEALDLMNTEFQLQHLDIKPQNLFLVHNHIKVADFGLVKDLEGRVASVTGGVTPLYAAPEMFDGWISRYCDQYSLAIVYQEMLTGQRPFTGTNVHQLVMQHVQGKPNVTPLPPEERDIIGRALSKNPEERFQSCTDLVRAIRNARSPSSMEFNLGALQATPATAGNGEMQTPNSQATVTPSRHSAVMSDLPPGYSGGQTEVAKDKQPAKAPPELTGDGELFPALVIGLGRTGLEVVLHLNEQLEENFGSRDAVPHLRLMYLDTDPDAHQAAGTSLPNRDVLLARLNRASHYLKPREGRPRIETWFHTNMLYRIQRNQVTGGVRALGRLAFIDNYRAIAQRLRSDLEECLDPAALDTATKRVGLKMRSNRPRVYIATSLAGGTGSGMFIDLAYAVRQILKRLGYERPDIVGLLLLPAISNSPARRMASGNAFAALTELNHYSTFENVFTARFDDREGTIKDAEAPFSRTVLLPLPDGNAKPAAPPVTQLLGELVFRELTTPLSRAADSFREVSTSTVPAPERRLMCQTVGLFRFSWPRRVLLQRTARRMCRQLIERWLSKETVKPAEEIDKWANEEWDAKQFAAEHMIARMQAACERAVGKPPETAFDSLTAPLTPRGWWKPQADPDALMATIAKLEEWTGQPSASTVLNKPGILEETVRAEAESAVTDGMRALNGLAVPLIEQPEFRLAGAERAARRLLALVEQALSHHEPLCQELNGKASNAYERLQMLRPLIRDIVSGEHRNPTLMTEILDLVRKYPKWRYQGLVLKAINSVYTGLRDFLSDQLREIGTCRSRLNELAQRLDSPGERLHEQSSAERPCLYPGGCRTLEEAVEQTVNRITSAEMAELDGKMRTMIRQQFRSLHHACTTSAHLLNKLEGAMLEETIAFAGTRLADNDVVEMFLSRHATPDQAEDELASAYEEAAPKLKRGEGASESEFCILAVPPSPKEGQLRECARQAVAEAELMPAASVDDIVIYREETQLVLAEVEQLGPAGREAYQQMATSEHFTPHSRNDVAQWQSTAPATR
jgi:serine/threonine protein kinase